MKKLFFVSIIIAIAAAFLASSHPDGLDFIAEKFSFSEKGQERTAPMADYSVGFMPEGGISTSTAGIAGILITLGIFWIVAYILKKGDNGMKGKMALLCLAFLVVSLPVFAARPLVTDDFYTVSEGGYEVELGSSSTQNQTSTAKEAVLSFKRGFLSNLDLGIEVPYTFSDSSHTYTGLNDILLHLKYCFWAPTEDNGLTARIDYKFKNGRMDQGLGSGQEDYWLMLIGSKMFGDAKTHVNLGFVNVGYNAGNPNDDYWAYSAAIEYPSFGEKGDLVAEYVANNAINPHPSFIQLGGRYALASNFKIDAGYAFGLNDNSIKNSATAGLHWEF